MAKRLKVALNPILFAMVASILSLAVLVPIAGCAENYGRLVRNQEINELFNAYRVLADHRYYFSGPEGRPDAVMGIHHAYTLESTQWTEIEPTDARLKKLIDWINFHHRSRTRYYPYGFAILDPDGNRIGIWYSIWDWTTVLVETNHRLKIFPPAREEPFGNGDEPKRMRSE